MTDINFQKDIDDIRQIPIVPVLLDVICQTTRMGFAAIARVTEDKWLTCSVQDNIAFGLKPGDELQIKTTICDEVRQVKRPIVIDHVANDVDFFNHHTPAMYGFQSYISVPIIRKDGSFFGTLCAIDPQPNKLNTPSIKGMFNLFADLISFHLHAIDQVNLSKADLLQEREMHQRDSELQKRFTEELEIQVQERTRQLSEKNSTLEKLNTELESFAYISSHDLQEPLRKIQTFSTLIAEREDQHLSETGRRYFERIRHAAYRMQNLIRDLLAYSRVNAHERKFENSDLYKMIAEIQEDLTEELKEKQGVIEVSGIANFNMIAFQFRQLLYNIISNAIKFSKPGRPLHISITTEIADAADIKNEALSTAGKHCHIRIADNGIGFEEEYNDRIFKLFQRLNNLNEYEGTGIGLAIVKKIVDNHNGIITASGKIDEGATFDIYIPAGL